MTDYNQVAYELLYILKYGQSLAGAAESFAWTDDEDFDVGQVMALGHWLKSFVETAGTLK